jgi:hypothetical protein
LAATVMLTLPLPVPPVDPSVTQESPSEAVHWQPLPAVTLTLNVPPEARKAWLVADKPYVQT